jgi:penicillin amidase
MPRVIDPSEGLIATANNRTVGKSFPHPVATSWAGMSRAGRILECLQQGGPWDAMGFETLQRDPVSNFHRAFIQGLGLLQGFDGTAETGSLAFSRADLLRRAFRRRLLEHLLWGTDLKAQDYRHPGDELWLLAAAQASPAQWQAAGLGDKAAFIQACLSEAMVRPDWSRPWGTVNELRMQHPFGYGGGLLGWLLNPAPRQLPGAARAIRVLTGTHGQSMRMVVDLADLDATRLAIPLGQSGHLSDPHRADQGRAWDMGDPDGKTTRLHQKAVQSLVFHP